MPVLSGEKNPASQSHLYPTLQKEEREKKDLIFNFLFTFSKRQLGKQWIETNYATLPFFSANSEWIGFTQASGLKQNCSYGYTEGFLNVAQDASSQNDLTVYVKYEVYSLLKFNDLLAAF